MGQRLRAGLDRLAAKHGLQISQSGPPQMPLMLFADDASFAKGSAFCSAALRAGAYFHPKHNMFLSCAHTEAGIDRALEAAGEGFAAVARMV
jgi:glutamate-1-semialdehyde 2,1-aminomutase